MKSAFFPWKDSYSVEIQEIDNQHKVITGMLNELYDAFMKKEHENKVGEIISKLTDYASYHFGTEEKYFSRFNYGGMSEHIKEHQDFAEKVNTFKDEFAQNKGALTYKIINFLRDWLMNHILISDKRYVKCFTENGLE